MRQASRSPLVGLPNEVLICLALTPLAWVLYLAGQILLDGTISLVQLGMAGLCSLVLFSLRAWGRWLCVAYDVLLVTSLAYQVSQGQGSPLVMVQGAAFVLAAGALFWPATRRAFRQATLQPEAGAVSQ